MGLLNIFGKSEPTLLTLPSGSFTVGADGNIVASTISSGFPRKHLQDIARVVLRSFTMAQDAGLPLSDLNIEFPTFRITARELRGGALVFLIPVNVGATKRAK
jgi:hypothetical protein